MKIFFDTEFNTAGNLVTLLAIGMVREDGATYYAENGDADLRYVDPWVQQHVIPHFTGPVRTKEQIAREVREFMGRTPELWAYFCTFDHILLMDLFGGWNGTIEPAHVCHDLETLFLLHGETAEAMPKIEGAAHNALNDAHWVRNAYLHMRDM